MGKPQIITIICDTCGLPWDDHKKQDMALDSNASPTVLDETVSPLECIRLLKEKLATATFPRS